jgi:Cu/Ag efflux protein CusF
MFRKVTLFAFLFLFGCLGYVLAQSAAHPPEERQFPKEQPLVDEQNVPEQTPQKMTGEIQAINLEKKTITIKDDSSHTTQDVDFNDTTTFSKDAKSITINDLKKGDKVSLLVDGKNVVTKVELATSETVPPPQK